MSIEPINVASQAVSQVVRATCLDPDCAFTRLSVQSLDVGFGGGDLKKEVSLHVQLSGHTVYLHDERALIVGRAATTTPGRH